MPQLALRNIKRYFPTEIKQGQPLYRGQRFTFKKIACRQEKWANAEKKGKSPAKLL